MKRALLLFGIFMLSISTQAQSDLEYFTTAVHSTFGTEGYYSALISQGKSDPLFAPKVLSTNSDYPFIMLNAVKFTYDPDRKRTNIQYLKVEPKKATKKQVENSGSDFDYNTTRVYKNYCTVVHAFELNENTNSGDHVAKGAYIFPNISPFTKTIQGLKKLGDSTYVIFSINTLPNISSDTIRAEVKAKGFASMEKYFDFNTLSVDLISRDKTKAKNADLDGIRSETIAYIKSELSAGEQAYRDAQVKALNDVRRKPKGMVNATLEADLWARVKKQYAAGTDKPQINGGVLSDFRIVSTKWNTFTNSNGEIEDQFIYTEFLITKGDKCYIGSYNFRRDYEGFGKYSSTIHFGGDITFEPILCANAAK